MNLSIHNRIRVWPVQSQFFCRPMQWKGFGCWPGKISKHDCGWNEISGRGHCIYPHGQRLRREIIAKKSRNHTSRGTGVREEHSVFDMTRNKKILSALAKWTSFNTQILLCHYCCHELWCGIRRSDQPLKSTLAQNVEHLFGVRSLHPDKNGFRKQLNDMHLSLYRGGSVRHGPSTFLPRRTYYTMSTELCNFDDKPIYGYGIHKIVTYCEYQ